MTPTPRTKASDVAQDRHRAEIEARAARCVNDSVETGAALYVRERDFAKLFPRQSKVLTGTSEIVEFLEGALRAEANRVRHWTYDGNRHMAIKQAHLAESRRLAAERGEDTFKLVGETEIVKRFAAAGAMKEAAE